MAIVRASTLVPLIIAIDHPPILCRLYLQFLGWDRLKKRFDEKETQDNIIVDQGEEEWVEEEKEVAVLSEEEVPEDEDAVDMTSLKR